VSQLGRVAEHRARLYGSGIPFLSVLVAPLPDGASHSVAYAGDVVLAEPGPADAEPGRAAEDLLSLGLVDRIVRRAALRAELSRLIQLLSPK
jgi:acetyl-CoA carboxylase beta subunit